MASKSATPDPAAEAPGSRSLPDTVLVGTIGRPHGVRGEVKVDVQSDVPERFARGSELLLVRPGRSGRPVTVRGFRPARGGGILALDGVDDRDAAEALRGAQLEVKREDVPEAPEGFYYYWQLEGCRCFEAGAGELGEVLEVIEDGGGHLLRVRGGGCEVLVPFVDAFLERVDVAAGRIDLCLPPGLLETCTTREPKGPGPKGSSR